MPDLARLDDLYKFLLLELKAAPDTLVMDTALQWALRDFCSETESWKETLDFNLTADEDDYTIVSSYDAVVERLLKVYQRTAAEVTDDDDGSLQDAGVYTFNPATNVLTFDDAPDTTVANGLRVEVVLVPRWNSNEIAEWFLNRYGSAIVHGAVAKLCMMDGKPWAQPEKAALAQRKYDSAKCDARREATAEFKNVSIQARSLGWL